MCPTESDPVNNVVKNDSVTNSRFAFDSLGGSKKKIT